MITFKTYLEMLPVLKTRELMGIHANTGAAKAKGGFFPKEFIEDFFGNNEDANEWLRSHKGKILPGFDRNKNHQRAVITWEGVIYTAAREAGIHEDIIITMVYDGVLPFNNTWWRDKSVFNKFVCLQQPKESNGEIYLSESYDGDTILDSNQFSHYQKLIKESTGLSFFDIIYERE